ncbi:hypothetical protein FRZ44_38470 [Hypericibacter terrae]|uniref:Uncharacterized protein n=1 Tax=Hypericibacter terrae TaxID=2602015 RepID=A0A5J6MR68_9PROT|nr:hypothetical protein [Hypericibacter terrae]QEX18540.1 hypothetical protein FRZ44_38470 [Hypericibacter terrae]
MKPPPNWPAGVTPLRMDKACAAYFVGLTVSEFERQVADGRLPPPERIRNVDRWRTSALRQAVDPARSPEQDNRSDEELLAGLDHGDDRQTARH